MYRHQTMMLEPYLGSYVETTKGSMHSTIHIDTLVPRGWSISASLSLTQQGMEMLGGEISPVNTRGKVWEFADESAAAEVRRLIELSRIHAGWAAVETERMNAEAEARRLAQPVDREKFLTAVISQSGYGRNGWEPVERQVATAWAEELCGPEVTQGESKAVAERVSKTLAQWYRSGRPTPEQLAEEAAAEAEAERISAEAQQAELIELVEAEKAREAEALRLAKAREAHAAQRSSDRVKQTPSSPFASLAGLAASLPD